MTDQIIPGQNLQKLLDCWRRDVESAMADQTIQGQDLQKLLHRWRRDVETAMTDQTMRGQDLQKLLDRWRRDVESGRNTDEWERELIQELNGNPTDPHPRFLPKLREWNQWNQKSRSK